MCNLILYRIREKRRTKARNRFWSRAENEWRAENERLRKALRMLANYGSPAPRQWWAEDIRRIALAALGEEK